MFHIILVLLLCFSSTWAQGGDLFDADPGGDIKGPEQAKKTAEELNALNKDDSPVCEGMTCYPGATTTEGLKDFDKNCRMNPNDTKNLQIKKICNNDKEGQEVLGQGAKRKKRQSGPDPSEEIYLWKCDHAAQSCCRTCRRTIPMIETIEKDGRKMYPIFCPVEGGFQLKDDVACVQQGCRKPCQKAFTLYSFLVTSIPPDGFNGHCKMELLPVWFTSVKMDTHCVCPKEGRGK